MSAAVTFRKRTAVTSDTPEKPKCSKCGGTGWLPGDDEFSVRSCICRTVAMLKARLGEDITSHATPLRESPFIEMAGANLLITGEWPEVCSHLHFVLTRRILDTGFRFSFRVITDEDLRAGYLAGGEADEERMAEMVAPEIDLVIVRLGFIGYKNAAMPGILLTALRKREASLKPTWLIDTQKHLFSKGHLSWNEEVGAYVGERYDSAMIGRDIP